MNLDAGDPPLLEFIGVSIRRHRDELLAGISLAVRRQSVHVLVGPNGAGKTTLLSALLGQMAFEGRIVANWRGDGRIGYVPQTFAVDASLPVTVEDFLALTRQRRPVCFGVSRAIRRRVGELLQEVGLAGLERRALSVLSGGELRRVLLAHAVDTVPELLVLDEPASGLDEGGSRRLEALVRALKAEGCTVLMVSHNIDQVRRVADWVSVIDRSLIAEGPPDQTLSLDRVLALIPKASEGHAPR
jgi:zinc transport system ATP-binding protein